MGSKNPNFGKKLSEKIRKKMSVARKGGNDGSFKKVNVGQEKLNLRKVKFHIIKERKQHQLKEKSFRQVKRKDGIEQEDKPKKNQIEKTECI